VGISVGYTSMDRINRLVKRPLVLFGAYFAYLCAITWFDDSYLVQIVGVSLSLAIIYWAGVSGDEAGNIYKVMILLGQYSLFAYIAQIVILQIVRRSLVPFGPSMGLSGVAFLVCLTGTIVSVAALDRARPRVTALNKVYTAVFS
jgi:hypothetical protein